ncbi:type II toxin-antitoxin system Phd/YefM family antitoxin [bacterium]|nr:type II toxin-antitoxin system Phd/YefM family antitoxin [bacterium]
MRTKPKSKRRKAEIVLRDGKPSAVILDIDEYQSILERLEDIEDIEMLKSMREKSLKFRSLEDFLEEHESDVQGSNRTRR